MITNPARLLAIAVLVLLCFVSSCGFTTPSAATRTAKSGAPEVVRLEEVRTKDGMKEVVVGNSRGRYHLGCALDANSGPSPDYPIKSCMTPVPGKDYFVFNKTTRWKFPGAKEAATLRFYQDFSVAYKDQDNIALVPVEGEGWGMYTLDSWKKRL